MLTPLDAACLQMIEAANRPREAHYHLVNPPEPHPGHLLDQANLHLVSRHISMDQIGFDYYSNIVTYRV